MKLKILKQSLAPYLPRMLKVIPVKGMSVYQSIWIQPYAGSLSMGVQDSEITYACRVPAECEAGPAFGIVEGTRFLQVLGKLPDGDIYLEPQEKLSMVQARRRFSFNLAEPEWAMDFFTPDHDAVQIDGGAVNECLKFIHVSVASETVLDGPLACAFIHNTDKGLAIVGFNGVQLSVIYRENTGLNNLGRDLLIPNRHIKLLTNILSDGIFGCSIANDRLMLTSADMGQSVMLPLYMDDEFIDYGQVLSHQHVCSMAVDRQELIQILERLDSVSGVDGNFFTMDIDDGRIILSLSSSEGSGEEELQADVERGMDQVCFNLSSFINLVRTVPGEGRVLIRLAGPDKPAGLSPEEAADSARAVIMPVVPQMIAEGPVEEE